MQGYVDKYLDYLARVGQAPSSVKAARTPLNRWASWWHRSRRSPRSVTRQDVWEFFYGDHADGWRVTGRTLVQYSGHVTRFLLWCQQQQLVTTREDLTRVVGKIRMPEVELFRLDPPELAQLIHNVDNPRDRAAVALNIHGFARLSEVQALRLKDIHLDAGYIRWRISKTARIIDKPITGLLDRELRAWLSTYPGLVGGAEPEWFAIPRRKLRNLGTAQQVWVWEPNEPAVQLTRLFQQHTEPIMGRIKGQGGSHTLRRSAAYALVLSHDNPEEGLSAAQHMLGHKSRSQTEHYVGLTPNALAADRLLHGRDFLPDLSGVVRLRGTDGQREAV